MWRHAPALAAALALAGCAERIAVRVSNESTHPVHDVRVSTNLESMSLETLQPGASLTRAWRIRGDDVSDGEYRFTFRSGPSGADSISQGFGYYSNGAVAADALRLVVRDTTYTVVLQEGWSLMETAYSMRSRSSLRYRYRYTIW